MLGPKVTKALFRRKPDNKRIPYAKLVSDQTKLSLIVCYAPTNDAYDTLKDDFYDNLHSVIDSITLHELICTASDLNTKVGQDRLCCPEVMGHHGLSTNNKNEALLVSFAMGNDLLIGGTLFRHKDIHNCTWTSPDGTVKNQIDLFLIRWRWRTSLKDF